MPFTVAAGAPPFTLHLRTAASVLQEVEVTGKRLTDLTLSETLTALRGIDYFSEQVTAQGVDSRFFRPYLSPCG